MAPSLPCPQRHVDTGMGFERVTAIIQGTKNLIDFTGTISNYETDVFRPIFDEIEKLSGKRYGSTLPKTGSARRDRAGENRRRLSCHRRPHPHSQFRDRRRHPAGNEGPRLRSRRILRRAVRYGRIVRFSRTVLLQTVDVLARTMGDVFPELRERQTALQETLRAKRNPSISTLDKGIALFEAEIARLEERTRLACRFRRNRMPSRRISGAFAFRLYDEQGFPLDLTELMARERGLTVDTEGFEKLMEEQREARAQGAKEKRHRSRGNGRPFANPLSRLRARSHRRRRRGDFRCW